MWDKWKKKIQNFIWEEVEEQTTIEHPKKEEEIPNIEARMVYQYPNRKSFHFPIIPEQVKRKDDKDIPAFKRRVHYKQNDISKSTQPQQEDESQETPKQRFKPSEVPSPIYGFQQRRQQKEVDHVPAFMRKKEKEKENNEQQPISKREHDKGKIEERIKELEKKPSIENDIPRIEDKEEPNRSTEYVAEMKKKVKDENVSVKPDRNQREVRRDNQSKQSIPFNVMMTPRDKKNLQERSKVSPPMEIKGEDKRTNQSLPIHLLDDSQQDGNSNDIWVTEQRALLEKTLKHFNVKARVVHATQGPSVTRFEIQPDLGVKVSKIKNLSDDLKLNMAARDIRIEAPIPGKNTVGIEVPNPKAQMVNLQDIVESSAFSDNPSPLTIALGLSIEGSPIVTNIQKMPHGLIAGATGSGKSVCINTILVSLIYKASYEDVKFLLIDPKMVELAPYNGIPHLVSPVITDVKAATAALKWAVGEMEERYDKFVHEGVRDIERFNQKVNRENRSQEKMPYIVIVIDELADLMMVSPQDVEDAICRIAQKARACGIHLLLATQRPSVDVLTGLIKANIPTRIAFSVSSQVDSRTILDTAGAEKLLGRGDMLFIENGAGKSVRIQGPFVSDDEIERVTKYARNIAEPNYLFEQESLLQQMTIDEEEDDLLQEVIQFVLHQNSASTSLLQRHFKIGYNRAARLIDTLESKGIISGQNGSKPRDILVTHSQISEGF
ncbi:DNA translocase FtsK [Ornithinibacillus salinisoli]|uniref:DNA translocase FtsK n=2 Tax=Ornithinibacillus salinisoli TaxID=1848459 RepID=A0ABW4W757_9BACI